MNIAVLGAGAWGSALAIALAQSHTVCLWARDAAQSAAMQAARENRRYLPGHPLPEALSVHADFTAALAGAGLIIVATPIAGLRQTLERLRASAASIAVPILWLCKGLEAGSGELPHQVAAQVWAGGRHAAGVGVLTGPSFADEVARGLPTALTLACADAAFAAVWARALSGPRLRIYANDDVVGAEVGGAVKNVLAIACGVSDGLGLGFNARAALITRGLAEIVRFGMALGARRETLMGLAGMGDLILTCTGDLSRNRRVGLALAAGQSLERIVTDLGHVAEGVSSAREVARRAAALQVEMPIVTAVCALIDGQLGAAQAVERLMARDPRAE
jgi:glycerol-3-phosphate dehydrogenase (NAD(P)+)